MPLTAASRRSAESGQASVELVAAVPALLLVGLVAWQLVLAGHAAWACANAARVAARAEAVGRDARTAARSALPHHLRRGLRVDAGGDVVRVRVRVPLVVPGRPGPVTVSAAAALGGGG